MNPGRTISSGKNQKKENYESIMASLPENDLSFQKHEKE